jgi:hypothetical protein
VAAHTEWGSPYTAVERYDRLADAVEAAIDVAAVAKLAGF